MVVMVATSSLRMVPAAREAQVGPGYNWGLLAALSLCVEFWVLVGVILAHLL